MSTETKPTNIGAADAQAQRDALKVSLPPESQDALGETDAGTETTYQYLTHRMSADSDMGREFNIAGAAGFQFKSSVVAPDHMVITIFEKVVKA